MQRAAEVPAARAGRVNLRGAELPRLGFGAMRITGAGGWGAPQDPEAVRALLRCALDFGVRFIDTADSYGPETSEEQIARALHPYPADLVIATKGGVLQPIRGNWVRNARPEHLRAACEASLRRLRLDAVWLYQLHGVDPEVPLEESVGALVDLQSAGKIRDIGLCNVDVGQLRRAQAIATIASVQNRYSLVDRRSDRVVDVCEAAELVFIPWAPLERGALSTADPRLTRVAARYEAKPLQIALAWQLARSPSILAIPGTSRIGHLRENIAAAAICLDSRDLDELNALSDEAAPS
jgi:pyridoxine 4-dehydrogenase